jgi:hypothetical protein
MNLEYLNLDQHNIPEDADTQVAVFLIASDLKARRLINGLADIGCDNCFCIPELCDLILAMIGFDDRPNELYDFYFNLLDSHCKSVTHENDPPVKQAFSIYKILKKKRG